MEAKLQALSIAADNAEYELDEAVARQDSIAEESFETPEQEADIQRRHNGLDDQIDQLQGVLDDALALLSEGLDEAERYYGISSPGSDDEEQDEGGEGGQRGLVRSKATVIRPVVSVALQCWP